jgi:hypothetical protein
MNIFNQMCSTIRTLNNKTEHDTQMKFYKALAVLVLTYGSKVWSVIKSRKQKLKLEKLNF